MATEFIQIPKHKYEQLQKDASATVQDLSITEPSTDNNNSTSATTATTTTSDVKQLPHDEPAKSFHDPDHAKLDETSVSDTNSDNGDDDYDTTDVLESFNSTKVKCVHPILSLMEQNVDILTWSKKTGEIVFHKQNIRDSNIFELLKDMFTTNLHPIGEMEFYRGLDLLKVKLNCIKHPKNKALLTIMKGEKKIVNKKNNGGGRKMKTVKKNKNWISWV